MSTSEEEVDWSNLPYDILGAIMNNLVTPDISNQIRCSAVCTSWRTVYADCFPFVHLPAPPFLIVPMPPRPPSSIERKKEKKKKKKNRSNTKTLSFYNIIHKRVYNQFQVTIPSNRHFRGSSYGWLVAVDQEDNDCQVRLYNPFLSTSTPVRSSSLYSFFSLISVYNNNEIPLPSLKHIPAEENNIDRDYCICSHNSPLSYAYLRKAVLSCDPLHSTPTGYCIVMAIFGQRSRLAFCSPGDKTWTLVDHKTASHPELSTYFDDVIYYKDRFLALHHHGTIIVLDPAQNMTITLEISSRPRFQVLSSDKLYLTVIDGVLIQIHREVEFGDEDWVIKRQPYSTDRFGVFTLVDTTKNNYCDIAKLYGAHRKDQEDDNGELEWKVTKNLWGNTLFLGDNTSMSIRASHYPGLCEPNSIYFTDDYISMYHCTPWNGPHDLGVFNLENETIENHYPTNHNTPIWPIPIWIESVVKVKRKNTTRPFGRY